MNYMLIKNAMGFVGGFGVNAVVSNIIKATTPTDISKLQKVSVFVGSFVIGSAAGEWAGNYVKKTLEDTWDVFKDKETDYE